MRCKAGLRSSPMKAALPSAFNIQVSCTASVVLTYLHPASWSAKDWSCASACLQLAMLSFTPYRPCAHCSFLEGPILLEAVAPLEVAAWGAWAAGVERTSSAACLEVSGSERQSLESAVISHPSSVSAPARY